MVDVYVGIGHGTTPTGVYDPGAVAAGGTQEHEIAHHVVDGFVAGLKRSKVSVQYEVDVYGDGHADDPNFVGSTSRANASGALAAVEVHLDFTGGVRGYAGQYCGARSLGLSKAMVTRFRADGHPLASDTGRENHVDRCGQLYFLDHTTMPALIPEIDIVRDDYVVDDLMARGESLAAGMCDWLGRTYVKPSTQGGLIDFMATSDQISKWFDTLFAETDINVGSSDPEKSAKEVARDLLFFRGMRLRRAGTARPEGGDEVASVQQGWDHEDGAALPAVG